MMRVRQFLAAEGGVGGATYVCTAEARHHVMKGRHAHFLAGQRRGERRMGMHHGTRLGPCGIDVAMETPFG